MVDQISYQKLEDQFKNLDKVLREDPKKTIESILDSMRQIFLCETVCLLLWNEGQQKLITVTNSNLPHHMSPEEYEYDKGLTGRYIFSKEKTFRGLVECSNKQIFDQNQEAYIKDDTINWTNILAFQEKSAHKDFKSLLGIPVIATRQWRGVLKLINKTDGDGILLPNGFPVEDQILLLFFVQKLEHIVAIRQNEIQIRNLIELQAEGAKEDSIQTTIRKTTHLFCDTLNYKICAISLFKKGEFGEPFQNSLNVIASDLKPLSLGDRVSVTVLWNEEDVLICEYVNREIKLVNNEIEPRIYYFAKKHELKSYIRLPISFQGELLGVMECGTKLPQKIAIEDIEAAKSFADSLALILINKRKSKDLSEMAKVTGSLSIEDIYRSIVEHIVRQIGFDYAVISRVDHENRTVKLTKSDTAFPKLINPDEWKSMADYTFDDKDILVDLVKKPKIAIISGPEAMQNWDPRLNREIFEKFNHKELVRVYVPIILETPTNPSEKKVVSIIEAGYHIRHQKVVPERQIELIELFGNYAESIYKASNMEEKLCLDNMSEIINRPDLLLEPTSAPIKIYKKLILIICEYLGTDAVGIWEKELNQNSFKLKLTEASPKLDAYYKKKSLKYLRDNSYTAEVVKSQDGDIAVFGEKELKSKKFDHPDIPLSLGVDSMICVPLKIGREIYFVVDIFVKNRILFEGEKKALKRLADRAASTIQSARIIESFEEIAKLSPGDDIRVTLKAIAQNALKVLHANSVVLFQYRNGSFIDYMVDEGDFYRKWSKNSPIRIEDNEIVDHIVRHRSQFFSNEEEYNDFVKKNNIIRRQGKYKNGFWRREKLESSAGLRLSLKDNDQSVGVMFVNYRSPQNFNEANRNLLKAFARQAASAINNAFLFEQNKSFWEMRRRDSLALSVSEIASGLAHNSGNMVNAMILPFAGLKYDLEKKYKNKKLIPKSMVKKLVAYFDQPLRRLSNDFQLLENYEKFDIFEPAVHYILPLIKNSLLLLELKFKKKGIKIKEKLKANEKVVCDSNQIEHLMLNLFLNAYDAMNNKGNLEIETDFTDDGDLIIIKVTDDGIGIGAEIESKIFEPFFTTKRNQGGTGHGLPISRYIAERHGGHIKYSPGPDNVGSKFSVYLPIYKEEQDAED